jgi:stage V sporulation protein AE
LDSRVRVILITDGDKVARRAMEYASGRLGLRCISASAGNPTPMTGPELVDLVKQAAYDPVLVMVDDKGNPGCGPGEEALAYICTHPEIQVLGAIAVASNTRRARGTLVDVSITRDGRVINFPVNKNGLPEVHRPFLQGDTVDVLRELNLPVVVGIGDPGKMDGADCLEHGCEVTTKAIMEVLARTLGQPPLLPGQEAPDQPYR